MCPCDFLSPSLTLLKRPVYSAWKLCGVLNVKCQSVSARRPFSSGLLGDETSDLAVCIRHLGVCDWACMCVCVCLCGHAINGCVCFSRCVKMGTVCTGEKARPCEGGVFPDWLSCEYIMFRVNMPLPNKGASVPSAKAQAPQWPDPNLVQFGTGYDSPGV